MYVAKKEKNTAVTDKTEPEEIRSRRGKVLVVDDNAFEMRKSIDFSSENIMQTLGEIATDKRFTGILVTDAENPSSIIYYGSDDVTKEYLLDTLKRYDNISGHPNKSYCGRYTGTDGYYYDYVLVSRTDKSGIILCYKRRRIDDVEDARFSTATLLHGYNFEKKRRYSRNRRHGDHGVKYP